MTLQGLRPRTSGSSSQQVAPIPTALPWLITETSNEGLVPSGLQRDATGYEGEQGGVGGVMSVTTDRYRPICMTSRPIRQLSVTLHDVYATNHFVLWGQAEGTPDLTFPMVPLASFKAEQQTRYMEVVALHIAKASSGFSHHRDAMSRTSFASCVLTSFTVPYFSPFPPCTSATRA